MAWNEPGGGKQRDPWRDGGGSGGGGGPDLEAILMRIRNFFNRLTGGRGGNGGGAGSGGSGGSMVLIAAIGIVLAWVLFDSWSVVDARQAGVVLRFGRFERLLVPGFHFKFPRPIERVLNVETTQVRSVSDQVRMLTNDENIVLVDFNVQYQVSDARKFLFSMRNPEDTLRQAAEAAVRSVVGSNSMDTILSSQGAQLVSNARAKLQETLDSYDCGIAVTDVSFQNVSPPQEVKSAFDDVNNAREDKQRIENEANAYSSKVIPEARGAAARITAEAAGYKAERIARAQGEADRFDLVRKAYENAPEVTRQRLWLETIEEVLAKNQKVLDDGRGKNLIYLPLDRNEKSLPPIDAAAGDDSSGSASTRPDATSADKHDGGTP
ncbi:MAG: FtsH protease activity modulator HflK [Rhodanobacteraceae bacterium]